MSAIPVIAWCLAGAVELSSYENDYLALALVVIGLLWALGAVVTWPPVFQRIRGRHLPGLAGSGVKEISASPQEDIVLWKPVDRAVVKSATVRVRGLARTFENNVVVQELQSDGKWVTLGVTTAQGGGLGAYGEFSLDVWLDPGKHHLRVGDFHPIGGSDDEIDLFYGAKIEITVELR